MTCEDVNDVVREYYGDHYALESAFNEICDFKETDTVQKYLNDIDGLNVNSKMTNHCLINIISNGITMKTFFLTQPCGKGNYSTWT